MTLRLLGIGLLLAALATSCGPGKRLRRAQPNVGATDTTTQALNGAARKLLTQLQAANFSCETLEIKGKGRFEDAKDKQSFTYKLRIRRGSGIWLSVTVVGFEGVRLLATPDQVQVLNRLENTHLRADYSWLSRQVGLQVDYPMLEHLLLGNFPLAAEQVQRAEVRGDSPLFISQTPQATAQIVINKAELRPASIVGTLTQTAQKSTLRYQSYQALAQGRLPFSIHLQVEGTKPLQVQLQHKTVQLNPDKLTMPFSVPDDYKTEQPR